MNKIIKILMERDGISKEEAEELINETCEEILSGDPFEAEEIMAENLGLEMDYIFDLL